MFEVKSIPGVKKFENVIHTLPRHPFKKYSKRSLKLITSVAIHQAMAKNQTAYNYANYHVKSLEWPGIGYDVVVERNGCVKIANYFEHRNYHVGNSNNEAIGICLSGDFRVVNGKPIQEVTKEQRESLYYVLKYLFELKTVLPNLKDIKGHCEYPGYEWKECPGFDMNKFRKDYSDWLIKLNKPEPKPEPKFESSKHFADVPKGKYYTEACDNLYELGLLTGIKEDKSTGKSILGLGRTVTIQDLAVITYRIIKFLSKQKE